jgi:hypothetical protein
MRQIFAGAMTTVMAGVALVTGVATSASAQSNLDGGKSAAQMFAHGCSACHRTPQEVAGASSDFLLEHYTTGPRQADAMAAYLETVRKEPARAAKPRRAPTTGAALTLEVVWTGSVRAKPTAAAKKSEPVPLPVPAPASSPATAPIPIPVPDPAPLYFEE